MRMSRVITAVRRHMHRWRDLRSSETAPILSMDNVSHYLYRNVCDADWVDVPIPKVHHLTDGGKIRFSYDVISIYKFPEARIHPLSDIVRLHEGVVWHKTQRVTVNMEIPHDHDVLTYDLERSMVTLRRSEKSIWIENGFSLFGAKAAVWSHFIVELFPKLEYLKSLGDMAPIEILVPQTVDAHIERIIRDTIEKVPNASLRLIPPDTEVVCRNLYWCSPVSYLCNHANYVHPAAIIISEPTRRSVAAMAAAYGKRCDVSHKIFVGRTGYRNLSNYDQVEALFVAAGYRVVYPHQLSFDGKIALFSNATHVAGPASSGIMNAIFSKKEITNVCWFFNFERCLDAYLTQLAEELSNLRCWVLIGSFMGSSGINAGYKLEMRVLKEFLENSAFDNALLAQLNTVDDISG
jgi:capsular polysaccharide biosynthesis protein